MDKNVLTLGLRTTLAATLSAEITMLQEHYNQFKKFSDEVIVSVEEEEEMIDMLKSLEAHIEGLRTMYKFHNDKAEKLALEDPDTLLVAIDNLDEFLPLDSKLGSMISKMSGVFRALVDLKELLEDEDEVPEMGFMESYLCSDAGEEEDVNWLDKLLQLVDSEFGLYMHEPTLPFPFDCKRAISFMPLAKVKTLTPPSKARDVIGVLNKFAERMIELQNILGINLEDKVPRSDEAQLEKILKKRFEKFNKKYEKKYDSKLKNILKSYLSELRGT